MVRFLVFSFAILVFVLVVKVSRCPIRILCLGVHGSLSLLGAARGPIRILRLVLVLRGHDVGAGSVLFVLDLHAFCASGGFVSVLGVGAFLFSECDY